MPRPTGRKPRVKCSACGKEVAARVESGFYGEAQLHKAASTGKWCEGSGRKGIPVKGPEAP